MRWVCLLLVLPLLHGCGGSSAQEVAARRAQQRHDRTEQAELAAQKPPKVMRYRLEDGELLVLDVPTVAPGGFADGQKCFLWRDTEFRTATLACPPDTPANLPDIQ